MVGGRRPGGTQRILSPPFPQGANLLLTLQGDVKLGQYWECSQGRVQWKPPALGDLGQATLLLEPQFPHLENPAGTWMRLVGVEAEVGPGTQGWRVSSPSQTWPGLRPVAAVAGPGPPAHLSLSPGAGWQVGQSAGESSCSSLQLTSGCRASSRRLWPRGSLSSGLHTGEAVHWAEGGAHGGAPGHPICALL